MGVSIEAKQELQTLLSEFLQFLNNPNKPINPLDYVLRLENVTRRLQKESEKYKSVSGLIFVLNFYNIWVMFRNQKVRFNAKIHNRHPCGFIAHHLIKYCIERMVYATDRMFLTAPCSGIQLPQPLACSIFEVLKDVRSKCTTAWRRLGAGRRQLMVLGAQTLDTYITLKNEGKINKSLDAFLKLSFPLLDINKLFIPIYQHAVGIVPDFSASCSFGDGDKRRAPHGCLYKREVSGQKFCIPDPLFTNPTESSLFDSCKGNISELLEDPDVILTTNPLIDFGPQCLHEIFSEAVANPSKLCALTSFNGVYERVCSRKTHKCPKYAPLGPFSPVSPACASSEETRFSFDQQIPSSSAEDQLIVVNPIQTSLPTAPMDTLEAIEVSNKPQCGQKRSFDEPTETTEEHQTPPSKRSSPDPTEMAMSALQYQHQTECYAEESCTGAATSIVQSMVAAGDLHSDDTTTCSDLSFSMAPGQENIPSREDILLDEAINDIFCSLDSLATAPEQPADGEASSPFSLAEIYEHLFGNDDSGWDGL